MDAFQNCTRLQARIQPGKQALARKDRESLVEGTAQCSASLAFEEAVAGMRPSLKRWDYFIESSARRGAIHALEIHQYAEADLLSKRDGTRQLLDDCCPGASSRISSWIAVIRGPMPRADIAARFKARTSIRVVGRTLNLDQL